MAQFKGSTHQYDLTQENEVNNLIPVGFIPFLKVMQKIYVNADNGSFFS